jgi:uncharacterized membrane protein
MPSLPVHPALVHLPLGLAIAIPFVAAGLALALWRGKLPRAAFAVVIGMQGLLVASGAVAMRAGEQDEERVARVVGERVVEAHEERAEAFLWVAGLVLAGSVAVLALPRKHAPLAAAAVAIGTLAVAGMAVATGKAGGAIVYQHGGAEAFAPSRAAPAAAREVEEGHERAD